MTRILIVEDEIILAEDLREQLEEMGYRVVGIADSHESAVRLAGETMPDVLFMDIRLRGPGDGIDAARDIRRLYNLPVVFMTAHSDRDTVARAMRTEPFGYINKPWDARDLRTAVELALAKHAAESRLRESETLYRTTVESARDGIITVDSEGRIILINPAAERLTGWTREEVDGKPLSSVFTRGEESEPGKDHPLTSIVGRDGRRVLVEDVSGSISLGPGVTGGAVFSLRDVSRRHDWEAARREIERIEAAESLNQGSANEFNNLIRPILAGAERLKYRVAYDPEAVRLLGEILDATRDALRLTRRLTSTTRKHDGPLDLSDSIRQMAVLLTSIASRKVIFSFDLAPDLSAIRGSSSRLRLLIMTLTMHASDALGDKGGIITFRTTRRPANAEDFEAALVVPAPSPGEFTVLEVIDDGSGSREERMEKLTSSQSAGQEESKALGVAAIVRESGGTATLENNGRETIVRVWFPVTDPAPPSMPIDQQTDEAGTLIFAEDEDLAREMGESLLGRAGYRVLVARDGREAVELFRTSDDVRLIVLDETMPKLNGLEALREMRAIRPNIPVILMSAFLPKRLAEEYIAADIDGFLPKPYRPLQLLNVVREVLRRRKPTNDTYYNRGIAKEPERASDFLAAKLDMDD